MYPNARTRATQPRSASSSRDVGERASRAISDLAAALKFSAIPRLYSAEIALRLLSLAQHVAVLRIGNVFVHISLQQQALELQCQCRFSDIQHIAVVRLIAFFKRWARIAIR